MSPHEQVVAFKHELEQLNLERDEKEKQLAKQLNLERDEKAKESCRRHINDLAQDDNQRYEDGKEEMRVEEAELLQRLRSLEARKASHVPALCHGFVQRREELVQILGRSIGQDNTRSHFNAGLRDIVPPSLKDLPEAQGHLYPSLGNPDGEIPRPSIEPPDSPATVRNQNERGGRPKGSGSPSVSSHYHLAS